MTPPPLAKTPTPHPPPSGGRRVQEVFIAALREADEDREDFLAAACEGDEALRREVEELLRASAGQPDDLRQMEAGAMKAEQAGDFIGPYKLREQIGEGGFGVVWIADQEQPVRRRVALKILKVGMDTRDVLSRFELERQALAMMEHPNIARVLDAGASSAGRPYFAMELVRGIRITDYCDQANIPTAARLELFIAVCNAVQHAHQKGIIHRDLKPSNILVTSHDGIPVPKVIDFGVAKAMQQRLTEHTIYTQHSQMVGTPAYMSPEQAEMSGLDIDTRADIYSLGVLLYELLTGRTPFDKAELMRDGLDSIRRVIREQDPPVPSFAFGTMPADTRLTVAHQRSTEPPRLIGLLRGDLDWIVMKAIEKDRARRYDTASMLAADIARHLRNEPVLARPPSAAYRFRRLVRRHKTVFASGAIVFVALVAATVLSVWQAVRAAREARRANSMVRELRDTAPAFFAQARALATQGELEAAIEKIGYAIQLQPEVAAYRMARGNLHQAQMRVREAAADFRAALERDPHSPRAAANVALCEKLLDAPPDPGGTLSRTALAELFTAMSAEQRSAAELMPAAQLLGRVNQIARDSWLERLKSLPNPTTKPFEQRLVVQPDGLLALDLADTNLTDLAPLRGMPLARLSLAYCRDLRVIDVLRGMPLRALDLAHTAVTDLTPIATLGKLEELRLDDTDVADLSPLADVPLQKLRIAHTKVADLGPLRGGSLTFLDLGRTRVTDLTPLANVPLIFLDCSFTNIPDFSPLAGRPIQELILQGVKVGDLRFAAGLPLHTLALTGARDIRNIRALLDIKELETLVLPKDIDQFLDGELDGVEALRGHPGLRRISNSLADTTHFDSVEPAQTFWQQYDRDIRWLRALRKLGLRQYVVRNSDGTWHVVVKDQPLADLAIFRGANISILDLSGCGKITDLSPLRGLPLVTLRLTYTGVTDLSPLTGMQLREFWMAGTKVSDLSPLRGMPLKLLYMDKCPAVTDLSPLTAADKLELFLVPPSANPGLLRGLQSLRRISYTCDISLREPTRTAVDFWKDWDSTSWLRTLGSKVLDFIPEQNADGSWSLAIGDPAFNDLKLLKGAHLQTLNLARSGIRDLVGIEEIELRRLRLDETRVSDVKPLQRAGSLREIVLPPAARNVAELRKLTALERISYSAAASGSPQQTAADFWQEFDKSGGR